MVGDGIRGRDRGRGVRGLVSGARGRLDVPGCRVTARGWLPSQRSDGVSTRAGVADGHAGSGRVIGWLGTDQDQPSPTEAEVALRIVRSDRVGSQTAGSD